ncbi:NAD-dependent epimerase/dehydratase family protein [Geodermatophilus sp. YIM 151500]|uniref:NAD-dependent epimerase/dehydratase family protein n=1 Tax=Geodermatophilus sp. YIM 151500 TaxID=2984531 RepID=UPI0021E36815|nr:NAD-dependent epimerase/dehydratase family protein [Geodermatophilus sp. YIM 151500]MCV2489955.1 NAD-dependent epimerase/dehydratase family protein [Geodermatophilus sp. YIM 151500]
MSAPRARGRSPRPGGGRPRGRRASPTGPGLTVAVTGPTGTFGSGLVPLLQDDARVARVVGIARRPFDPAQRGWTKMTYRQGDVRDPEALRQAFRDADVVVHLAFLITGNAPRATTRAINVDGTLNVYRAAAAVGARRFVYASSVAAYGFHADNPARMDEEWPVRPAARLFYAQEKAELEHLLAAEAAPGGGPDLYVLRPSVVLGPDTVGGKDVLPGPLAPVGRWLFSRPRRLPLPVPVVVPEHPLQLVHQDDVGSALLLCAVGAGPPGAYNIAGDGVLTAGDVAREFGALPVRVPAAPAQLAARALARVPFLPPVAEWVEAAARPAVMDTTKAREQLGWRPRYTGLEALRDTLRPRA